MYLTRYLLTHELNDDSSVLVNTLSGAIDVIENRFLPVINDPKALTPDFEIFQPLLDRGYIFASKSEEEAEMAKLFRDYTADKKPMSFVICPTYSCNLRCVYCFEGSLPTEQPRVLSSEEIDAVFAAIDQLATFEPHIQLFGGEPFLPITHAAVTRIFERAAAGGYPVSAVTNGVNIRSFMPLLRKHLENIDDFQVTVDGPAAVHDVRRPHAGGQGSFAAIIDGIQLALDEGIRVRMRVNIDTENIDHILELAHFIIDKGWTKMKNFGAVLSPVDDHQGGVIPNRLNEHEAAREWFRLKKAHPELELFRVDLFRNLDYLMNAFGAQEQKYPRFQYCESNNLSSYVFGTDGKVYLCAEAIGDERLSVGRYYPELVLNEAAMSQWNGRSIMSLKKCRDCAIATLCGGGCAVSACRVNGALDQPFCHGALETVHAYLDSISEELLAPKVPV